MVHVKDAANRHCRMFLDAEQHDDWTLEGVFRLLDVNQTGQISPADFAQGLQELGRCLGADALASISEADCEQLMAIFDTNHNGRVSLLASDNEGGHWIQWIQGLIVVCMWF